MVRILIVALLLCSTSLRADPIEMTHPLIKGDASFGFSRSYPFKVEIRQVTVAKIAQRREHDWSRYDDRHAYVCSSFSILLDGRNIRIPKVAYTDLCCSQDVAPPERREDGRWIVKVERDSGGESDEMEFVFDALRLLERRVTVEVPSKTTREVRKF